MAYFAKINDEDVVVHVIFIENSVIEDKDFPESEPIGQEFIKSIGLEGNWLQTSYNNNFRSIYAGEGYTYDRINDIFIQPKEEEVENNLA